MFEFKCGPYHHPKGRHPHPYYVGFMEEEEDRCTVIKDDPWKPTDHIVDLKEKRWGRVCDCEHHTIRKAPCLHIDFAKKARLKVRELRGIWER